ncbi:hypothetical protein NOVO_05825 [Rickettsiales bacterium Ac37b]|nr:hypothetical protein NOVO_05825 [Rickettsiales bacterium Ac37b]
MGGCFSCLGGNKGKKDQDDPTYNKGEAWENVDLSGNRGTEAQGSNVRGELPHNLPAIPESNKESCSNEGINSTVVNTPALLVNDVAVVTIRGDSTLLTE